MAAVLVACFGLLAGTESATSAAHPVWKGTVTIDATVKEVNYFGDAQEFTYTARAILVASVGRRLAGVGR